jgi:hypothetical protein
MPQATYLVNPATNQGVSIGFADPTLYNKAQRQASFMAAMIALFIQNNQNNNVLDDGNLTEMLANYEGALTGWLYSGVIPVARQRLTATTNYYVGGTGANDSNPGTSALPWATLQHAVNQINGQTDIANQLVVVNSTGAFTAGCIINAPFLGSLAPQQILFNFASGSSVTATNSPAFFGAGGAQFMIQGPVTISAPGLSGNTAGYGIYASPTANIIVGNGVIFGACAAAHMAGNVTVSGPAYTISGSSPAHVSAPVNTAVSFVSQSFNGSIAVTLTGTPAFSIGFATASHGVISCPSTNVSFTGAGTGPRYVGTYQSIIATSGGGASFFPGNSAGAVDAFSMYV